MICAKHPLKSALLALIVIVVSTGRAADTELPALNVDGGNRRVPGKFIWADLVTDDVIKARNFYGRLFDWQFWGVGNYSIAANNDNAIAGMFQKPRPAN